MKAHGRDKVLFGTNYPMILPYKCLEDLPALELEAEVSDRFLRENALLVFDLA